MAADIQKTSNNQSASSSTLVIALKNQANSLEEILDPIKTLLEEASNIKELYVVDLYSEDETIATLRNHDFFKELESSGKAGIIQASNLGEGLTKAAYKAKGANLITWTNGTSVTPNSIIEWILHTPYSDQILSGKSEGTDKTTKRKLKTIQAQECKNGKRYKRFTNLRMADPDNPVKIYPTSIAKYLFAQTDPTSDHFEAEALHRAQLEGVPIIEKPVNFSQGIPLGSQKDLKGLNTFFRCMAFKFNYQVKEPIQAILGKDIAERPSTMPDPQYGARLGFSLFLLFLVVVMPVISVDFGITADGPLQFIYGRKLLEYYASFGQDQNALDFHNLYLYGGGFDIVATGAAQIFDPLIEGGNYKFEIRHIINALYGFLGILFTGLFGKLLGGWRGGLFAILFLALSPRFFGHSMNNPKDIPFAAFFAMSLYFMVKYFKEFPTPDKRTLIWLIVGIAYAINIRIGGLLLIAYFGLFSLLELGRLSYSSKVSFSQKTKYLKETIKYGSLVVVLGYLGGLVFWPYGHLAPFTNPFKALSEMSNFSSVFSILFNGEEIWSNEVPWNYIFTYLGITSPLFVLLGFAIFMIYLPVSEKSRNFRFLLYILFAAFFPVGYIIYKDSNLYDGIRQVLFIYPPIVLLSSWGVNRLYQHLQKREFKIGFLIVLGGLMILPLSHMIRNHPHQYVYYNEIIGGVDGAYGQFELDYWNNSSKGAAEAIGSYVQKNVPADSTVKVYAMFAGSLRPILQRYANNWEIVYGESYETRHEEDWDFAMFIARYISPEKLKNEWPPEETFYKEKVDNTTINIVLKKPEI